MRQVFAPLITCVALLGAGCTNVPEASDTVADRLVSAVRGAAAAVTSPTSTTGTAAPAGISRAQFAAISEPIWIVTLEQTGAVATIVRVAQTQGFETFQAADGIAITLANGVVQATRGFGDDIMQSDTRALRAALARGGSQGTYQRTLAYLDGQDQMVTRTVTCQLERQGPETITILGKSHRTRRMVEDCNSPDLQFRNRFWTEQGTVVQSRQWIAPGVSPLILRRLK